MITISAPPPHAPSMALPGGAFIKSLGYIGIEASDIAHWRRFSAEVLGLQVEEDGDGLRLKMDDRACRILITEGPADDLVFAGWEVADNASLEAYSRHLDSIGVAYVWGGTADAVFRDVARLLRVCDPNGVVHEVYVEGTAPRSPFTPRVTRGDFVLGPGGLGHIVFGSADYEGSIAFAHDVLGARLSDVIEQQLAPGVSAHVTFMHVNERHHSIAFAGRKGAKALHHFMIEVARIEDVGLARDRHLASGLAIAQDIGQHPNDRMISYYGATPSGFLVEYGWGGVKVDVNAWTPGAYDKMSEWGHRPVIRSAPAPAAAQPKETPMSASGAWTIYITTPMGEQKADLVLDEALTGVITAQDSPAKVYDGALEGDNLRFKADVAKPFPMTLAFDLTIEGSTVEGEVEAGPMGPVPVRGERA